MLCFRYIAALAVWSLLGTSPALAQQDPGARPPALRKLVKKQIQQRRAASPTDLLERLQKLTPDQREAVFATFPEERRDQVRRRFDAFNKLSPEERERLGENLVAFINLAPHRQELARAMFRRFASVTKDRQDSMRAEMKVLAELSPEDRRARVNADEFRNRFSADEKILMFDMLRIFPGRRAVVRPEVVQQQ